ncbi:MAG: hypothetical protein AAF171_23545 [Cyanobacteria bacterium P01_A01_bin.116]
MSLSAIASFGKKLLFLAEQVDKNAEEIKALRQELSTLTEFTHKIARVVQRNQDRAVDKEEILVLKLKNALSELENRLLTSDQVGNGNDGNGSRPEIEPSEK